VVGDGFDEEAAADLGNYGGQIVARVPASEARKLVALGDKGVEVVEINGVSIEADVVVIEVGRQPDIELALMAECAIGYRQEVGGFVPVRDENLRTSRSAILIAGDVAGICESSVAVSEGKFAGVSAAHALGLVDDSTLEHERARYVEATGDRSRLASLTTASYVQV
jgi:pyruvate/2-oxoglutarate dehydrogenase complex dihydrolipoamide dehydrogenase (E3) component